MNIEIDDNDLQKLLGEMLGRLSDPTPALGKIGALAESAVKSNFRVGGAYSSPDSVVGGSRKWEKLSRTTEKLREKKGFSSPFLILQESGLLAGSITHKVGAGHVEVGTNLEYATMQHYGARKGEFGTHSASTRAFTRTTKGGKKARVKAHQRRVRLPWGDIPAWPFMTIHPDTIEDMLDFLAKFVMAEKNPG